MKNKNKNQRFFILVVLILLVVGGTGFLYIRKQRQEQTFAMQEVVYGQSENFEKLKQAIEGIYDPEDPNFLIADFGEEDLTQLVTALGEANNTLLQTGAKGEYYTEVNQKCNDLLETARKKLAIQKEVNQLFEEYKKEKVMNGRKIRSKRIIKETVTTAELQKLREHLNLGQPKNSFEEKVLQLFNEAQSQAEQNEKATALVEELYKDDKVVSTDGALYESAVMEVAKVQNTSLQQKLTGILDKIKEQLPKEVVEKASALGVKAKIDTFIQNGGLQEVVAATVQSVAQTVVPENKVPVNNNQTGTTPSSSQNTNNSWWWESESGSSSSGTTKPSSSSSSYSSSYSSTRPSSSSTSTTSTSHGISSSSSSKDNSSSSLHESTTKPSSEASSKETSPSKETSATSTTATKESSDKGPANSSNEENSKAPSSTDDKGQTSQESKQPAEENTVVSEVPKP